MADYVFHTHWRLEAPIEEVWEAIWKVDQWHEWWSAVKEVVELKPGDAQGIGAIRRYVWRSPLGYKLIFDMELTKVDAPKYLEGNAKGELEGIGIWRLTQHNTVTHIHYEWRVNANKPWMRILAPIARPAFRWAHNQVMRSGGEGLARRLNVPLLSHSDRETL